MRSRLRLLGLLALIVAALLAVAACGDDDDDSGSGDTASLSTVNDGTLTVCTDAPYEPFEFEENGEFTGFDIEILRAIATNLDLDLDVIVQPFDGIWLKPAAGACDIVGSAMTITEERAAAALFSDPYFDANQSLLVRADETDQIDSLDALAGKTIGVQTGTTGATYARENTPDGATIKDFDEPAAMFPALTSGDVDALLQDFPVNLDRANKDDRFAVVAEFETGEQYGFAMEQDNTALGDAVNEQLAALRDDGTYDEIYEKYFPSAG